MGLFLKTFAEHVSAFWYWGEKWRQFHFTLAGQLHGPLANCIELGGKQLRCCADRAWIFRFTNSGKRKIEKPAMS